MIAFDHMQTEIPEGDNYDVTVIGIGGAGSNVIDRLALDGMGEAEIVCMNTDIRALTNSMAGRKVQLGRDVTKGLGAGGDPELGLDVAEASEEEIREVVKGRDIIFICTGLGGGTGSGAAPYVARLAKEAGAFVVVFAIMPFGFEGRRRRSQADEALERLSEEASALLTFENGRMGELVLPKEGIQAAFAAADEVIGQSVRAVTGIVLRPGLIRIGMDDLIRALENDDSRCLFGYGEATGESRAQEALASALRSPLLERGVLLSKSRNVLVHVTGGKTMTLTEVELLMTELGKQIGDEAQILFGTGFDPKLGDRLAVTVISSLGQVIEVKEEVAAVSEVSEVEEEIVVDGVVVGDGSEEVVEAVAEAVVEEEVVEEEEAVVEEVVVARDPRPSGELELGEISTNRAPRNQRSVGSAAMAEIEEVVAETLLDLGMEDSAEEEVEEEEMLAEVEEFVEIEDEESVAAVEQAEDVVVASAVEGAEDVEAVAEAVGEEEVEASVVEEVERVEEEDAETVSEVSEDAVVGEVGEPPVEEEVVQENVIPDTDEYLEEAARVEAKIEAIAAAMGAVEKEEPIEEEMPAREERAVEDERGVEASEALAEEEAMVAEEEVVVIEEEVVAVEERELEDERGVEVGEALAEKEAVVAEEEAVVIEEEVAAVEEKAVEEEVVAEGKGIEGAMVAESPVAEEEEEANYFVPEEEVLRVTDEEPEEELVGSDEEHVAAAEEAEETYVPSPNYGKTDEELGDEVIESFDEVEDDEEDERVLAMTADTGHTNPAEAKAVGPRVGLVEPKPSDPTGQGMLELDPASKGRFDNSSPTVVDGEDLDVPTFLRKRKMK